MKKVSEITLLNCGSLLCLVAFPLLYGGVHAKNETFLMIGMTCMTVAALLPVYAAYLHRKKA